MEKEVGKIVVDASDARQRVDVFVAQKTSVTRSQVQRLIDEGHLRVDGKTVARNYRIKPGEVIDIETPRKESGELVPEALPLEILYRDSHVIVVNKPAGMVVYPGAGHYRGTLMNAVAYYCRDLATTGGPLRPGVVHRLDKDTSGVMVVALSDAAYYDLVEQFRERTIERRYVVLVYGDLKSDAGEIALPIGRSGTDRKKMSTRTRRGKEAVTRWKVLRRFGSATQVEARLATGRTHQIRVHFASIGHPVLGDRTYGRKTEIEIGKRTVPIPRQMLHAELLGFRHPSSGDYIELSSPLPEDMACVIEILSSQLPGGTSR